MRFRRRKQSSETKRREFKRRFPFSGFEPRGEIPFVDRLSDDDLRELNGILDWNCFTVDARGRRLGNAAWEGKRQVPEPIPHPRVVAMHDHFDLAGKHVLEVGCFEGAHTIALCERAGRVTAIDGRIENVVKTIVRTSLYDHHPTVFKCDLEERPLDGARLRADLVHHVGVLYHLVDPVLHLMDLAEWTREGLLLCTHVANDEQATESYTVGEHSYRYLNYREGGRAEVFSGMYDEAKWLRYDCLLAALGHVGFGDVRILEDRDAGNRRRVTLVARR